MSNKRSNIVHCPNCGHRLSVFDLTLSAGLFWSCLIVIALNQAVNFYEWVRCLLWEC